ncbi:hypothetical protein NX801_09445 [Streptomyces sp. LP05-1]|uniref:Uncharacterized protein n=1 Tax=Streptomyces pyxinae TaxID=2970734 RepID=A0ABT2CEU5_9ACTN|nr:hypothetical protein [Streptomyces sp. LP05-1]MCS0635886.1 hypothetical protein [Streptomyces sp. LP05-1]
MSEVTQVTLDQPVAEPGNIHATGTETVAAADGIEIKNIHATGSPAERLITRNGPAATEPIGHDEDPVLDGAALGTSLADGIEPLGNIHATAEPVK